MTERLTLSLDAMGGDNAPQAVIEGMQIARTRMANVDFILFGDQAKLEPLLDAQPRTAGGRVEIRHTDQVVSGDDQPSRILRKGRSSSMWLAVDAVARGEAHGVVSSGNTGAFMAASKFLLRMLPGIDRPALVQVMPTERGKTVLLDLGANIDCNANNLVEFAVMGQAFGRIALNVEQPTVGLLNITADEFEGDATVRAAAVILRKAMPATFQGCIEGHDIMAGTVDVVVTNGFSGNIVLKAIEGTTKLYPHFLRAAVSASWTASLGYLLARRGLLRVRQKADPRNYNGGMFLGLNGIAVKSHGSTDAVGYASAIGMAVRLASLGINERIKAEMELLKTASPVEEQPVTV